ncbi:MULTISPECIES: hypothetical protein [Cupriavidus]|uniref:DUF1484 family protein n=1 Tax=Cupriavidus oxalaticus TaxID=96344 RepID=A0A4P7LFW6_9BURK|nr:MULTISPECIES: hypothetical protein [Cupriavidus]MBF6991547.1 hypothetical protein [Cupriavidus sp. IK-TO18]QBY51387.1 hypothetical protein E0W60_09780 [Cupriavidus oxalaticus]BDB26852.1 DUF1484 family protein [Cupriavidus sp. P-10]GLC92541.1 hypothetical protein Tamer19_19490 [Cupriavidus sp. TA19]
MTIEPVETSVSLHQIRAGIEGVLALLEQLSVRSEECFSALCLLGMVQAKLAELMDADPLTA